MIPRELRQHRHNIQQQIMQLGKDVLLLRHLKKSSGGLRPQTPKG
jgi:hypothetical protein